MLRLLVALFGIALVVPPTLSAGPKMCVRGEPTPESYTWDFDAEAKMLLNEMSFHAREVTTSAGRLEALARFPTLVSWQSHAVELTTSKEHVNRMGEILCRLEIIRHVTSPWEQDAITRARPMVETIAANTEAAIEFLNANREQLFDPAYEGHIAEMYGEASDLAESMDTFVAYGDAVERLNKLPES